MTMKEKIIDEMCKCNHKKSEHKSLFPSVYTMELPCPFCRKENPFKTVSHTGWFSKGSGWYYCPKEDMVCMFTVREVYSFDKRIFSEKFLKGLIELSNNKEDSNDLAKLAKETKGHGQCTKCNCSQFTWTRFIFEE